MDIREGLIDRADGDEEAQDDGVGKDEDAALWCCEHAGTRIGGGNDLFLRVTARASWSYSVSNSVSNSVSEDDQDDQEEDADDDIERDLSVIRRGRIRGLLSTPTSAG